MMMVNSGPTTVKNSHANNINTGSFIALKLSAYLSTSFNNFNNFCPEQKNERENAMNSNYDTDQFQTLKFSGKNKSISLFHINAC